MANSYVIDRDDTVALHIHMDEKGVYLETEKTDRDHNFVSDDIDLSPEEMDEICKLWLKFRDA